MRNSPATPVSCSTPPPAEPRIRSVSVIGAGVMGCEIAAASVRAGYRVRIADADPQVAATAVREILASSTFVNRPHFAHTPSPPVVTAATSDAEIADADLVIEAIPENLAAKQAVLRRIEPHLRNEAIIASNTSSIPLGELARALKSADRLCGLHFCHPVAERSLVEVIAATTTSAETIQRVCNFAVDLGKSPVIVRDGPGFALNRILSPYLTEALELLLEGVGMETLERVAREFGMPYGPLRQLDEFGIDVGLAVGGTLLMAFPDRFIPSELLIAMHKAGRRGCKAGGGFLADADGGTADRLDPAVREIIAQRSRKKRELKIDEVRRRLLLPMYLEATRVLEESIVDSPDVIDVILGDGLGMTSRYRGLFGWAEAIGAETLLEWLIPLQPLGKRFEPTPLLRAAAEDRAPVGKR